MWIPFCRAMSLCIRVAQVKGLITYRALGEQAWYNEESWLLSTAQISGTLGPLLSSLLLYPRLCMSPNHPSKTNLSPQM